MLDDAFGFPLSTASVRARDAYVAGVDSVLSALPQAPMLLTQAVTEDPRFALAQVALARAWLLQGEPARALPAVARARDLVVHASAREQSHVHAVCLSMEGRSAEALAATLEHLRHWPRDAMVLAPATGVFGLIGFSGRLEREQSLYALLTSLAHHYDRHWWFDGVLGFAACETGRLDEARTRVERSLATHPASANGMHFHAHVAYELGELASSLTFLEQRLATLDRACAMHCHLSWHRVLAALGLGDAAGAWQAYLDAVHPQRALIDRASAGDPAGSAAQEYGEAGDDAQGAASSGPEGRRGAWGPPLNLVTDTVSFLWRSELAGRPRDVSRWGEARAVALHCYPQAGLAFADLHTLLACIVCDDQVSLQRLRAQARDCAADGRYASGDVVPMLIEGFIAYERGDWPAAIDALTRVLPQVVRLGGSRAQRDLVDATLAAACLRDGRPEPATAALRRCAG